jgi:hypothetical protein
VGTCVSDLVHDLKSPMRRRDLSFEDNGTEHGPVG